MRLIHADDIQWTGSGIALGTLGQPLVRPGRSVRTAHPSPDPDPLDAVQPTVIVVRWRELGGFEAVDPWPSFRVRWRYPGGEDGETFGPAQRWGARAFEKVVIELAAHIAARTGRETQNGWLLTPAHEWEVIDALPEEVAPVADGAYRTAGRAAGERIVARRRERGLARMLHWVVARSTPWRDQPVEVVITEGHVWVQRQSGVVQRMERSRCSGMVTTEGGDRIYAFGRRERLLLTAKDDDGVIAALDADATRVSES